MHAATALLAVAFALFIGYFVFGGPRIKRNGQPLRRPPNTLPLVGNGILFLQARHRLFSWFVKCEKQFGFETFQISVPSLPPGVVINDPKNLEYVLKNEGIFTKGDFFKRRSWDLFGNGIINSDGAIWRVQRKAGLHFLSSANMKVLTDVVLPRYLKKTIEALEELEEGSIIDLEAIFHELTTQLMGKMAYNMDMHNTDPFSMSFDYASGVTGHRFQNPLWQVTEIFFGGQFRDSVAKIKEFGSVIVKNAMKVRQSKDYTSKPTFSSETDVTVDSISGSLINSLLDTIDDQQMVADAALNYLSAGRDTTAQALTWTFHLLMRHPKTAEEIRRDVGLLSGSSMGQKTSIFHVDTAAFRPASLPFVMAIFYEALRLYPPVPFELKQCEEPTSLPDGTFLPQNSILVWCTWAMNRSQRIWGNDADDFKPARWLEDGYLISKTAFEYPVFNGGPRTCMGKKMAEVVAVQVIATLISKFDFVALDGKERISKDSLTLPMEGGLPCCLRKRMKSK